MRQEFNVAFDRHQWPRHIAIARMAFVVGHEMSHIAFDPISWFLHANGTARPLRTWTPSFARDLETMRLCQAENYNQLEKDPAYRTDFGFRDSNENMADIVGERVAFDVYSELVKEEPQLPGEIGDKGKGAIFFAAIATAPLYCISQTSQNALAKWKQALHLIGDVHSFGEFRVNGFVSHSQHFPSVFGCPRLRPGADLCPSFF